jgi:hypothetical protein
MSKISRQDTPVNAFYSLACNDLSEEHSPVKSDVPGQPALKFIQRIDIPKNEYSVYLASIKDDDINNLLPITSAKLTLIHINNAKNLNISIELKHENYIFTFNIPFRTLQNCNYSLPSILFPIYILNSDYHKIKSLSLIINNVVYPISWNIIYETYKDYMVIIPVNILDNTSKIYKKAIKKYTIMTTDKDKYEIYFRVFKINGDIVEHIPVFLLPRRKYPAYIYTYLIQIYLNGGVSYRDVAVLAENTFGVKISPSAICRALNLTKKAILQYESEPNPNPNPDPEPEPEPEAAAAAAVVASEKVKSVFSLLLGDGAAARTAQAAAASCGNFVRGWFSRYGLLFMTRNSNACYPP